MRAAFIEAHGASDVLRFGDVPDATPGPGEALVRVRACALNHLDLWTRRGLPGLKVPFPHVLGSDIAGEIASLPGPMEGLAVGQRVMLQPGTSCGRCRACLSGSDHTCRGYRIFGHQIAGGAAEFVSCPLPNLVPLPDGTDWHQAAAFPLVFLTAWQMLVPRARLERGEEVLVWAAGSGVGIAAIQIAVALGARVIATAGGERKLEQARALGAAHTIDHYRQDVVAEVRRLTGKKGVEVVVEHVGAASWERSILALAHGGRLVTCGATTGPLGRTDLRHLFAKRLSLLGSYMGSKADLLEAAKLWAAGQVKPIVHEVLPLREVRRAHELLEASGHFGKLVLDV